VSKRDSGTLLIDVNVDNEQVVLGALVRDPAAFQREAGALRPELFNHPRHRAIAAALRELRKRGASYAADSVVQLGAGEVDLAYLRKLEEQFEPLPPENLSIHLDQLRRDAAKFSAGEDFASLYASMDDPNAGLEEAQGHALSIVKKLRDAGSSATRVKKGRALHAEWMADLEESRSGKSPRFVPLRFTGLDEHLYAGLKPGDLVVLAARPGMGKALALDTKIPTPAGWVEMGSISVGETVFGSDGRRRSVRKVGEVLLRRPCFRVVFSDGSSLVADAEHLWLTRTDRERKGGGSGSVRTTVELARTLRVNQDDRLNHSVEPFPPLDLPEVMLPIEPYTLGVWLGDGGAADGRFGSEDPEIPRRVELDGYEVRVSSWSRRNFRAYNVIGLKKKLREAGLLGNKHIPQLYLRASELQRRELLAGLLDTDGYVENYGRTVRLDLCNRALFLDALQLVRSLGYRVGTGERAVKGRCPETSVSYRMWFSLDRGDLFKLGRKQNHFESYRSPRRQRRFVKMIEPVESVPVRCIEVDAPDGVYLAGEGMIPTHNSTFCSNLTLRQVLAGRRVLNCPVEAGTASVVDQMLCANAKVEAEKLVKTPDQLTDEEVFRMERSARAILDSGLVTFDDEVSSLDDLEMRVEEDDFDVVILDLFEYLLQGELKPAEVTDALRRLKKLGKRRKFCAVVVQQIRRIKRTRNPRPRLDELKNSGGYEEVGDLILLLHRSKYYDPESADEDVMEVKVAKQRRGPQNLTAGFLFDPKICRVGAHTTDFDGRK
jgi:replicative DNA helicase